MVRGPMVGYEMLCPRLTMATRHAQIRQHWRLSVDLALTPSAPDPAIAAATLDAKELVYTTTTAGAESDI
jgi:hypothetical protein